MAKKKSPKSPARDESKFANQKKISPEKATKTKLARIPDNEKKNKLKR